MARFFVISVFVFLSAKVEAATNYSDLGVKSIYSFVSNAFNTRIYDKDDKPEDNIDVIANSWFFGGGITYIHSGIDSPISIEGYFEVLALFYGYTASRKQGGSYSKANYTYARSNHVSACDSGYDASELNSIIMGDRGIFDKLRRDRASIQRGVYFGDIYDKLRFIAGANFKIDHYWLHGFGFGPKVGIAITEIGNKICSSGTKSSSTVSLLSGLAINYKYNLIQNMLNGGINISLLGGYSFMYKLTSVEGQYLMSKDNMSPYGWQQIELYEKPTDKEVSVRSLQDFGVLISELERSRQGNIRKYTTKIHNLDHMFYIGIAIDLVN